MRSATPLLISCRELLHYNQTPVVHRQGRTRPYRLTVPPSTAHASSHRQCRRVTSKSSSCFCFCPSPFPLLLPLLLFRSDSGPLRLVAMYLSISPGVAPSTRPRRGADPAGPGYSGSSDSRRRVRTGSAAGRETVTRAAGPPRGLRIH
eukprot:756959-Hanusia_phi.AAC.6